MRRLLGLLLLLMLLACAASAEAGGGELLRLSFDEGQGDTVGDASGRLPDAQVQYQYLRPAYTEAMDPQWRSAGVVNGCLLFDGASTCVAYQPADICLGGEALTISVWVAPRAFEWDDPNAADNGTAHLTAILGQYYKAGCQGVLLGYQRFGRLCFEVGTGENWHTLWADDERLSRGEWNLVTAVFDGVNGRMSLYLNGEEAASLSIPAGSAIAPAANEQLLIGKNAYAESIAAGTYNMFAGLMDELSVSAEALSAEAIAASVLTPSPIAHEDIALESILTGDIYKTQYHGGPYQHWMNEPHAPVYYNGMYHLFFQSNSVGTYWRNICWGHLVSEDTVRWRPVADAIVPTEGSVVPDGVWSGGAALDKNGVPVLFFTAGNDSFRQTPGLISNQNIGAAWPADLTDPELTDWVICPELAIAQKSGEGRPGEFRDPHIWKEGDAWYMLVCSGSAQTAGGSALLYVTDRLEVMPDGTIDMDWQYRGPIYEMENQSVLYGTSWELPILLPLSNPSGTITRYAFFISPAPASIADNKVYYFIGDFDRETGRFTPDPAMNGLPRMLDYGSNVFTGPSALVDPVTGRVCMFSIMQDQRSGAEEGAAGWAHCVGLTRNIGLNEDGTDVCVSVDPRVYSLLGEELLSLTDAGLAEANEALAQVSGDLLYVKAVLSAQGSEDFGLICKYAGRREQTTFTVHPGRETVEGYTVNRGRGAPVTVVEGPLPLKGEPVTLEVFIDRSLVEAYFNQDKAVSVRSYGKFDSQGLQLFGEDGLTVVSLEVRAVQSIYAD